MPQTITEKILAAHSEQKTVSPGEFIEANVDLAFGNDITAPLAIKILQDNKVAKVFDPGKVMVIPDHFTPNKDVKSAEQAKVLRDFAQKYHLTHYVEVGRVGIEHVWLHEQGYTLPGMLIIGADSHTCTYGALGAFATGVGSTDLAAAWISGKSWFKVPESLHIQYEGPRQPWVTGKDLILYTIGQIGVNGANYKAMEFVGSTISTLNMADRFSMANMAIEAGGKNGIFHVDNITKAYVKGTARRSGLSYKVFQSDPNAEYLESFTYETGSIDLQVAFPHLPENTKSINEVGEVPIDQAVIGSCTNGRIEDLEIAARIIKNRKVHPHVRCIILPGTPEVFLNALKQGYIASFIESGAIVSTPTCGPCLGGHMGVLAKDETAISTTNRNFIGRMGHPESKVYLASPAVATASAILGKIAGPTDLSPEPDPP